MKMIIQKSYKIFVIIFFSILIVTCGKNESNETTETDNSSNVNSSDEWAEHLSYQHYYKDKEAVKIHGIFDANNDKIVDLLLVYQAKNKGKAIF